jgi:hypothetical protein
MHTVMGVGIDQNIILKWVCGLDTSGFGKEPLMGSVNTITKF